MPVGWPQILGRAVAVAAAAIPSGCPSPIECRLAACPRPGAARARNRRIPGQLVAMTAAIGRPCAPSAALCAIGRPCAPSAASARHRPPVRAIAARMPDISAYAADVGADDRERVWAFRVVATRSRPHQSHEHHAPTLHTLRPHKSVDIRRENGHRVCKVRSGAPGRARAPRCLSCFVACARERMATS